MKSNKLIVLVALALLATSAWTATRVYHVEPKELHQGKVAGNQSHGIRQGFVANVDSIGCAAMANA